MKIKFSRHATYPGVDINVELIQSSRRTTALAYFKILAIGNKDIREALNADLSSWAAERRISLKSRCDTIVDTHAAYLRHWGQVAEFMAYWIGETNFSLMLEDASQTATRHHLDLYRIADEIKKLRALIVSQETRFTAAAEAFLAGTATA